MKRSKSASKFGWLPLPRTAWAQCIIVLSYFLFVSAAPGASGSVHDTARIFGADRFGTAADIAKQAFPGGAQVVYIVDGESFPDALAAAPAAASADAPVLLVTPTTVPGSTSEELKRLAPKSIVIVGGAAAVSTTVEKSLSQYTSGQVSRLQGQNRYGTAAAVALAPGLTNVAEVLVASGATYADALAGAAAAAHIGVPLLLTEPDHLTAVTATALTTIKPNLITILGGYGAVSSGVQAALQSLAKESTTRISGVNRYSTAEAIMEHYYSSAPTVYLASGENYPDALSVAASGRPLLLGQKNCLPTASAAAYVTLATVKVTVVGGISAVSDATLQGVPCQASPALPAGVHLPTTWQKALAVESTGSDSLALPLSTSKLQQLANTGANMVTIVIEVNQATSTSSVVTTGPSTPSDATLTKVVEQIHSLGLHVQFSIHDDLPAFGGWRGYFLPTDPTEWFDSYANEIGHFAALAQLDGVESLCIGTEMEAITTAYNSRWATIISQARASFSGTLTYDANWSDYQEDNGGVSFWSLLDQISLSGYFPLAGSDDVKNLESDWAVWDQNVIQPLSLKYNRPVVFNEIGYRNLDGAHLTPWAWDLKGPPDDVEQANDYEAFFDYWRTRSYFGGVTIWRWNLDDTPPGEESDYTPQGRLAMLTISAWFHA